jgi:hypothetical protein
METTALQNHWHPSWQKLFKFLGKQIVASVLSVSHLHSQSVGAPTVHVQLDSSYCQYCNVTLNLIGMPIWHVNSCRLRVQLPKEQPGAGAGGVHRCRLCQMRRKKGRAWWGAQRPRTMTDWDTQCRTSPVCQWMSRTQRTSRALSRRALDHRHWFGTSCTWTCRSRLRQRSTKRVFRSGYRHLEIMYVIILDIFESKTLILHESLWYVLWYH